MLSKSKYHNYHRFLIAFLEGNLKYHKYVIIDLVNLPDVDSWLCKSRGASTSCSEEETCCSLEQFIGLNAVGCGQVRSFDLKEVQNGRIFSKRYHCLFSDNPFGWTTGGN